MISKNLNTHRSKTINIFNSISKRYDISNLILSLGLEKWWRHEFLKRIKPEHKKILDACCGTGTSTYHIWRAGDREVWGMDFSARMVEVAKKKYSKEKGICFYTGDITDTGFPNDRFDCTTIAFGIRNILERKKALKELHRTIMPGGSIVVLEFNHLEGGFFGNISGFYINRVMPFMGGMLTGNKQAYDYLAKSIRDFPEPGKFKSIMESAGWSNIEYTPLNGGMISLFRGQKL